MDWSSIGSDADTEAVHCGEETAEAEGKALNLQVNLNPTFTYAHFEISFLHRVAGLSLGDRMRSLDI